MRSYFNYNLLNLNIKIIVIIILKNDYGNQRATSYKHQGVD